MSGFVINFVKQPLNSNNSDQEIQQFSTKLGLGIHYGTLLIILIHQIKKIL